MWLFGRALFLALSLVSTQSLHLTGTYRAIANPGTPADPTFDAATERPIFASPWFEDTATIKSQAFTSVFTEAAGVYDFADANFKPFGLNSAMALEFRVDLELDDKFQIEVGTGKVWGFLGYYNIAKSFTVVPLTSASLAQFTSLAAKATASGAGGALKGRVYLYYLRDSSAGGALMRQKFEFAGGDFLGSCSAETFGQPLADQYGAFVADDNIYLRGEAKIVGADIQLIEATSVLTSGQAWRAGRVRTLSGFTTTFEYTLNKGTTGEGFAFVIQAEDNIIRGDAASNMGYGAIRKAVAIEFDIKDNNVNDPSSNHVDVIFGGTDTIVPTERIASSCSQCASPPSLTGTHTVKISWTPITSMFNVWLDGVKISEVVLNGANKATLAQMWDQGFAFVGFTAATGGSNEGTSIAIRDWQFSVVPPTAATATSDLIASYVALGAPATLQQVTVTARDACNGLVPEGGDAVGINFYTAAPAGGSQGHTVVDSNDGTYEVRFWHSKAEDISMSVTLNGEILDPEPRDVNIFPAPVSAAHSTFAPATATFVAGADQAFTLTLFDQFENPLLATDVDANLRNSITAGLSVGDASAEASFTGNTVTWNLQSTKASTGQSMSFRVAGAEIGTAVMAGGGSPVVGVTINAGALDITKSTISMPLAFPTSPAVSIKAIPRDQWSNNIRDGSPFSNPVITLTPAAGMTLAPPVPVFSANVAPDTAQWETTLQSNRVGAVQVAMNVDVGGTTQSWNIDVTVTPGDTEPAKSRVCMTNNLAAQANPGDDLTCVAPLNAQDYAVGVLETLYIFTVDQFNNKRTGQIQGTLMVTVSFVGGGTVDVTCQNNGAAVEIVDEMTDITCDYVRSGYYKMNFRALAVGTYDVTGWIAGSPANLVHGAAQSLTTSSTQADPGVSYIVTASLAGTVQAGDTVNMRVFSLDLYGNPILTASTTVMPFKIEMMSGLQPRADPPSTYTLIDANTGEYNVPFSPQDVGAMQVSMFLSGSNHIRNSPAPLTVIPGDTHADHTVVYGSAVVGGVEGGSATVQIQSRDVWDNLQQDHNIVDELAQYAATYDPGTGPVTVTLAKDPAGGPHYRGDFLFPTSSAMDICVTFNGAPVCGSTGACAGNPTDVCDNVKIFSSSSVSDATTNWNAQYPPSSEVRATEGMTFSITPLADRFDAPPECTLTAGQQTLLADSIQCNGGNCDYSGTGHLETMVITFEAATPKVAGDYTLNCVHVGYGPILDVSTVAHNVVTIVPGPPSSDFSYVVTKSINLLEDANGHSEVVTLLFKDRDQNIISAFQGAELSNLNIRVDQGSLGALTYAGGTWTATISGLRTSGDLELAQTFPSGDVLATFTLIPGPLKTAYVMPETASIDWEFPSEITVTKAGSTLNICVHAKDAYGNFISTPSLLNQLAVSLDAGTDKINGIKNQVLQISDTTNCAGYVGQYVPTRIPPNPDAVPLEFHVYLRSDNTTSLSADAPTKILVASGPADESQSECIIAANPAALADGIEITFIGRDSFGNLLTQRLPVDAGNTAVYGASSVTYRALEGPVGFAPTDNIQDATLDGLGEWTLRHTTQLATTALTNPDDTIPPSPPVVYTYQIDVGGESVSNAPGCIDGVRLAAAAAHAENTVVDVPPTFVAGVTGGISMMLYDTNSAGTKKNRVDETGTDVLDVVILRRNSDTIQRCVDDLPNPLLDVTDLFQDLTFSRDAVGRVRLNIYTEKADEYVMYLKVNAQDTYVSCNFPPSGHYFTVVPGPWSPADSYTDTASGAVAGQSTTTRIRMTDEFLNQLSYDQFLDDTLVNKANGDLIVVSVGDTPVPACAVTDYLQVNVSNVLDRKDGSFTITFAETVAKEYSVVVNVETQRIGPSSPCATIVVRPWYVYSFTAAVTSPLYAAVTSQGTVAAFDQFGNLVTEGNHYFIATNVRTDDEDYPVWDYNFYALIQADVLRYTFAPEWPGMYVGTVNLVPAPEYLNFPRDPDLTQTLTFSVAASTCAETDAALPVQCPYDVATGYLSGKCVASFSDCPVPGSSNITKYLTAPAGGTSYLSCPPGSVRCADDVTCAASAADCRWIMEIDCNGLFRCHDGKCVDSAEDCSTPISCVEGSRAADSSCRATGVEVQTLPWCAYGDLCPDGSSCSLGVCPSHITCPATMVRCENGHCATSVADCPAESSCSGISSRRCPDGSCANNDMLCPSVKVCALPTPVHCPDGECVGHEELCRPLNVCPDVICPDGSCADTRDLCPTPTNCGPHTLASDGTCDVWSQGRARAEVCMDNDVRCPDGSCRNRIVDCPSRTACPVGRPVRCPDGTCAPGFLSCPSSMGRYLASPGPGHVCPNQAIVPFAEACPSERSCDPFTVRCEDGTCRSIEDCATVSTDDWQLCPQNTVACPQGDQGQTCAPHISLCPRAVTCPYNKPVSCIDATCAFTVEECTDAPPSYASRIACPDGTWAVTLAFCGKSVWCPAHLPVKCWDRTCRLTAQDCPPEPRCPKQRPYLCATGECNQRPSHCRSAPCSSSTGPVMCSMPISSGGEACTSPDQCWSPAAVTNYAAAFKDLYLDGTHKRCPQLTVRCRDGSCMRSASCPEYSCPAYIPVVCDNGLCVRDTADCPAAEPTPEELRTCTVARCHDGSCVDDVADCTAPLENEGITKNKLSGPVNVCPVNRPVRCSGGQCAASSADCVLYGYSVGMGNTCPFPTAERPGLANTPVLCSDQTTCVLTAAQCPVLAPCPELVGNVIQVRCPTGECVDDLGKCPTETPETVCSREYPFRCLDGLCVKEEAWCFTETDGARLGCPATGTRCPDGTCVMPPWDCNGQPANAPTAAPTTWAPTLDNYTRAPTTPMPTGAPTAMPTNDPNATSAPTGTLAPTYSAIDTTMPPGCVGGFLCENGSCNFDNAENKCPLVVNCPAKSATPYLCWDGSCVAMPDHCPLVAPCFDGQAPCAVNGQCIGAAACRALNYTRCPAPQPALCPNGACRRTVHDCANNRRAACPAGQFLCKGACISSAAECLASSFPLANLHAEVANVLCAGNPCWDGTCKADASDCPPVPACPANHWRCPSGECVASPGICQASYPSCAGSLSRCADGTCRKTCPPFSGCAVGFYHCEIGAYKCTATLAECNTDVGTPESCADCQHDIPAFAHTVHIPVDRDTIIDVSLDADNVPRTQLIVPSGALVTDGHFTVKEVPTSQIGVGAGLQADKDFSTKVLSSPFGCSSSNPSGDFQLNVTVLGAVDLVTYSSAASNDDPAKVTTEVPCEFVGQWRDSNNVFGSVICELNFVFSAEGYSLTSCGKQDISESWTLDTVDADDSWAQASDAAANTGFTPASPVSWVGTQDLPESLHCLCFYNPAAAAEVDELGITTRQKVCTTYERKQTDVALYRHNTVPDKCFPPPADAAAEADFTINRLDDLNTENACDSSAAIRFINPLDICLAKFVDEKRSGGKWECLQGYYERVAFPVWSADIGGPAHRVEGRISNCDETYAFVNMPLGDAPVRFIRVPTWWEQYGVATVITIVLLVLFGIGAAYGISRLLRYRTKYKEEKKMADALVDRQADLDQYGGGLGLADEDDEVDMVANPLVIELQMLEQQLEEQQRTENMATNTEKADLEAGTQLLVAQIRKVQAALAEQQGTAS